MEIIQRIWPYKNSQKYQHLLNIPQKSVRISDTFIMMSCCWCWWNPNFFIFNYLVMDGWMRANAAMKLAGIAWIYFLRFYVLRQSQ